MPTAKQQAVFGYIRGFLKEHSRGPTYREIQQRFGYASPYAAQTHVAALRREGLIRADIAGARSIMPTRIESGVPVFGTIPAGIPIDALQESEEVLDISPTIFGASDHDRVFALRVRGGSMERAGILDGDVAILVDRPARNGDVIAALVDGRSTLKRYVVKSGKIVLQAEGRGFRNVVPTDQLTIQGVMIGLIRRRR